MPSHTTRVITLEGPEALAFAHAQFSSDVLSLPVGQWQWSAWLDPKGRVKALLQVARVAGETLHAVARGGDVEAIAGDLRRFIFRTRVSIRVSGPCHVADGDAHDDYSAHIDDDVLVFGEGDASLRIGDVTRMDASDAWVARHITKGFAWLPDEAVATLLPPALSMERLGAVAFAKGCFPGQEIAARLHFLGGHKKHLRVVTSVTPLVAGQALRNVDRDFGIVLMTTSVNDMPTSLVVLDDAAALADTLETVDGRLHISSTFDA